MSKEGEVENRWDFQRDGEGAYFLFFSPCRDYGSMTHLSYIDVHPVEVEHMSVVSLAVCNLECLCVSKKL